MKKLILILILFSPLFSFSQKDTANNTKEENEVIFDEGSQVDPEFPGGQQAMIRFIINNVKYPAKAKENDISGKVYISFAIEKTGEIAEIKILKSVSPELDNEAIRVIKKMPKWTPGTQEGKPIRATFTLPINFRLS